MQVRSEIKILAQELASPLATSRSVLAMVLAGDLGELTAEQRTYLEQVMQLDEYMISLITSWVDMDRLNHGQVILNVEPCNIGSVLAGLQHKQTLLSRSSQWPMVLADPLRLKQIIINILDVFTKADVRVRTNTSMCILTFHDQTHGKDKQRTAILDALHNQAPSKLIGIRIARLLAEAHGGKLTLDPHRTMGTKLRLYLPLAKQMSLLGDPVE